MTALFPLDDAWMQTGGVSLIGKRLPTVVSLLRTAKGGGGISETQGDFTQITLRCMCMYEVCVRYRNISYAGEERRQGTNLRSLTLSTFLPTICLRCRKWHVGFRFASFSSSHATTLWYGTFTILALTLNVGENLTDQRKKQGAQKL